MGNSSRARLGLARHRTSRSFLQARAEMFAIYGTICHICHHDGADNADHLIPLSRDPDQPIDAHAMRPAHGVKGCPTCGRKCNVSRGNRPVKSPLKTSRDWYA